MHLVVAKKEGIELNEATAKQVLAPIRSLSPHADVVPALERLQQQGHRLVTMTNSSKAVLAEQMFPLGPTIDIVVPSFAELPEAISALSVHE